MSYARTICYLVTYVGLLFGGIFDNSTLYLSGTVGTPYINGNTELEDDYKYNIGLRKIALFPYQVKNNFLHLQYNHQC